MTTSTTNSVKTKFLILNEHLFKARCPDDTIWRFEVRGNQCVCSSFRKRGWQEVSRRTIKANPEQIQNQLIEVVLEKVFWKRQRVTEDQSEIKRLIQRR